MEPSIDCLKDDSIEEILLRLPSPASLACAALASIRWRRVASRSGFLGRFREAHPSSSSSHLLVGLFAFHDGDGLPVFHLAPPVRSDPDLAAIARGSDFLLTRLDDDPAWRLRDCHDGLLLLSRSGGGPLTVYDPVSLRRVTIRRPQLDGDGVIVPADGYILDSLIRCRGAKSSAFFSFRVVTTGASEPSCTSPARPGGASTHGGRNSGTGRWFRVVANGRQCRRPGSYSSDNYTHGSHPPLQADIWLFSMDQRDIAVLTREYCEDIKRETKPTIMLHNILPNLVDDPYLDHYYLYNMRDPKWNIFMHVKEHVVHRIRRAICPPKVAVSNPCLEYVRYVIFPWFGKFEVQKERDGSNKAFACMEELIVDYESGDLDPVDVKLALERGIYKILEHVDDYFNSKAEAQAVIMVLKDQIEPTVSADQLKIYRRTKILFILDTTPRYHDHEV